jgi:hypothetical protein
MPWRDDRKCPCSLSLWRARGTLRAKSCSAPSGPRILPVARRGKSYGLKRLKKSGGEGGIRTHGQDPLNHGVREIYGFAVPCNPLASPDFAVDLAIALRKWSAS